MNNSCRECRKFSEKLFIKGERCLGPKCALTRRVNAPGTSGSGKAGQGRRRKKSEYGIQLSEKQKAKRDYGLREKQFRLVYEKANRSQGATGEMMLQILELRLDNVVYRLGWACSRAQARQLVNHGHIKVNEKNVDIPSYIVKVKDIIKPVNTEILGKIGQNQNQTKAPAWLKADAKATKAEIVNLPTREQIEAPIDEQLIVEFYSR